MRYMSYADNTQAYDILKFPANRPKTSERIAAYITSVQTWMNNNMLKLNPEKFEYIVFHSKHQLPNQSICFGDKTFLPSVNVKNLGVYFDEKLKMDKHVSMISRSCYYHIQSIGKIRDYITTEACRTLVQSTVTSRLDYANVVLHGLPKTLLHKLQLVQNSSARLVTRTRKREHITPVLIKLHWLPIEHRIIYKVLLYTFKAIHDSAPAYVHELVKQYKPSRTLRSSSKSLLSIPTYKTETFGSRSFRVAAPNLWMNCPSISETQQP